MSPQVSLNDVLITDRLPFRAPRNNTYQALTTALIELSAEVAKKPEDVFQKLSEYGLALCRAQSAGISILEQHPGASHFRWHAIAGVLAPYAGGTMPLNSPCGLVVETNRPALFRRPETFFTRMLPLNASIEEALLVPFRIDEKPRGTVWVISHGKDIQFDPTDLTILSDLSNFASSAYRILVQLGYLSDHA